MNKEEVLKNLFQLSQEDILDIGKIINGYTGRIHKSPKDTLLMRCMFIAGYHSSKEFYDRNHITKDNSLANALNYEVSDIKVYLKLKKIFNIDNDLFLKILERLESKDELK